MRHRVIMHQIMAKAFKKTVRISIRQPDAVIRTCVIDQAVNPPMLFLNIRNSRAASLRLCLLRLKEVASRLVLNLMQKVFYIV